MYTATLGVNSADRVEAVALDDVLAVGSALVEQLRGHELDDHAARLRVALDRAVESRASGSPVPTNADRIATELWPAALAASGQGPLALLAERLSRLAPLMSWTQTETYVAAPPHEYFLRAYAHTTLLAPPLRATLTLDTTDQVVVGLLLLGPGNRYPHHYHPADEVYLPLTEASWSQHITDPYTSRPAGVPLRHRPSQPHGVEAGQAPLLTLYLWTGDLTTPAQLCASR